MGKIRIRVQAAAKKLVVPIAEDATIADLTEIVAHRINGPVNCLQTSDGFDLGEEDLVGDLLRDNDAVIVQADASVQASLPVAGSPVQSPAVLPSASRSVIPTGPEVVLKPVGSGGGCCGGRGSTGGCCKTDTPAHTKPVSAATAATAPSSRPGAPAMAVSAGGRVLLNDEDIAAGPAVTSAATPVAMSQRAAAEVAAAAPRIEPTPLLAEPLNGVPAPWYNTAPHCDTITAHADAVRSICVWGSDRLLTGSWDRRAAVWSLSGRLKLSDREGHTHCIEAVLPLTDSLFATGAMDWTVRLWQFPHPDGTCAAVMKHKAQVHALAMPGHNTHLFAADDDGTVLVWDYTTFTCITQRSVHPRDALALAACQGASVSGGSDGTVALWDTRAAAAGWAARMPAGVRALSATDRTLAVGCANGAVLLLDPRQNGRVLCAANEAHTGAVGAVSLCGDAAVASGGRDDGLVRLWGVNGEQLQRANELSGHSSCVFSVVAQEGRVLSGSNDMTVRVWDLRAVAAQPA